MRTTRGSGFEQGAPTPSPSYGVSSDPDRHYQTQSDISTQTHADPIPFKHNALTLNIAGVAAMRQEQSSPVHTARVHGMGTRMVFFPGVGKLGVCGRQLRISGVVWQQSPQKPTTGCENSA